jgi:hypothetical protein
MKVKIKNKELQVQRIVEIPPQKIVRFFIQEHGLVSLQGSIIGKSEVEIVKLIQKQAQK